MNTIKVLDHGFVTLRNLAGPTRRQTVPELENEEGFLRAFDADDTDVANAARMSFDASDEERSYEVEMKLNRYLMKNRHDTPFESIHVWLEWKAPIFIARQIFRHRTFTFNEVSGRYVTLPGEWYIPETVGGKPANAKQGQSDTLPLEDQAWFKRKLEDQCSKSYELYLEAKDRGVAMEHARLLLALNHYTHWMMNGSLRNLLHLLSLRDHSHAQVEAQEYGKAVTRLLEPHIPGLMALYRDLIKQE